jgi:hypothetical protein
VLDGVIGDVAGADFLAVPFTPDEKPGAMAVPSWTSSSASSAPTQWATRGMVERRRGTISLTNIQPACGLINVGMAPLGVYTQKPLPGA